jgi:GNAT superfamily N-acetyltransferase
VLVSIEPFRGRRTALLPFFEQADDSPSQIRSYIDLGEVLVASLDGRIIGHLQLIAAAAAEWEIRSMAVVTEERGRGVGRTLVATALDQAFSAGATRVRVATATADIGNLRFYQRLGFRMERIERDAFREELGYPNLKINDIPLRDRVWLSIDSPSQFRAYAPSPARTRHHL